jgi:hypothetical protein
MIFSADETADVGEDDATPVTEDYKAYDNKFTGKILEVTVEVGEMGAATPQRRPAAGRSSGRRVAPGGADVVSDVSEGMCGVPGIHR